MIIIRCKELFKIQVIFMKKNNLPSKFESLLWKNRAKACESWFFELRNRFKKSFFTLEKDYCNKKSLKLNNFKKNIWKKDYLDHSAGGGTSLVLRGNLFEKVGINISTVNGSFPDDYKMHIKGANEDPRFYATGISIVAHMKSPFVPAAHFNSRFIITKDAWFGGGCDITPTYMQNLIRKQFHKSLKTFCNNHDEDYYENFSKWCTNYFYLKHRKEERGIGGIFFDHLEDNWKNNFYFTKESGIFFLKYYSNLIKKYSHLEWSELQRKKLLKKRGRYVEFNLLYDKGTMFGLKTGGNINAILMSMPPSVEWN